MSKSHNLLEAVPIIDSVLDKAPYGYACVGGLPTEALLDPSTVIDTDNRAVHVDDGLVVSSLRANGTPRDIDLLAFTSDQTGIREYLATLTDQLDQHVVIQGASLSAYDTPAPRPPLVQLISQTVRHQDGSTTLQLGEVEQPIQASDLEATWQLHYQGASMHMLHPLVHYLSYRVRSIGGIRHKDADKVARLHDTLSSSFDPSDMGAYGAWLAFEAQLADTYNQDKLLTHPQRAPHILAKQALLAFERSDYAIRLVQQKNSPLTRVAHHILAMSKPSLNSRHAKS